MPTIDTRICAGVNLQLEDNGGYLCGSENMVNVIRRITPIEGERLQGFADNWTRPCFTQEQINDDNLVDQFVEVFKNWNDINGLTTKAKSREAVRKWMTTISSSDCPDGPRYKAIGNSMSVNVMEWIGLKIEREERRRNNQ